MIGSSRCLPLSRLVGVIALVLVFLQSLEKRSKLMWTCNRVPTHKFTNDGHKTGNFMPYSFSFVNRSLYVLDKTRTAAKCAKYAKVQKLKRQVHRARNCFFFFSLSLQFFDHLVAVVRSWLLHLCDSKLLLIDDRNAEQKRYK